MKIPICLQVFEAVFVYCGYNESIVKCLKLYFWVFMHVKVLSLIREYAFKLEGCPVGNGYVVGWGTLALINAGLAQGKNRSGLNWFLISLLCGPVATLFIVVWDRKSGTDPGNE
jgi:hypothetical protein